MKIIDIYVYCILAVVTICTLYLSKRYTTKPYDRSDIVVPKNYSGAIILMIVMTIFIGLRPISAIWQFADSANYYRSYLQIQGYSFHFDFEAENFLWDNLFAFFASNNISISFLFLLGDLLYFGCTFLACRKFFPHDTTAAYVVFLGAFSTISYSYNGVKAGIAGAIFLLAMAYYKTTLVSVVLVLISWGFHHSMQLLVAAYLLTLFFRNSKWYFYGWLFCMLMAVMHVTAFQELFASYTDESGKGYLMSGEGSDGFGGAGGFRIDFLIYSVFPVYFGYKYIMQQGIKVSKLYLSLLHVYLCTNGVWMLCMYASFTNRIAYLSWFMYPIVLIYPFLKEELYEGQYRTFSKVMKWHLAFTLFMELIYYKLIK